MKRSLRQWVIGSSVLLLTGIAAGPLWAQDQTTVSATDAQVPPPAHKHQVYVDDLGSVFWPVDLPFWIRLSPSAQEDAPSFLLNTIYEAEDDETTGRKSQQFGTLVPSTSGEDNITQTERYRASGLSLEIQGQQFVRWVNFLTKEESLFKFVADGAPPISTLKLREAPVFIKGGHTFFGKGLTAALTAQDALSGVRDVFFSIDGGAFVRYESELNLGQEKHYSLRRYAVDHVGYASTPQEVLFTVDLTTPTTVHATHQNLLGDTLSTSSVIRLSSEDALSGVQTVHYYFDGEDESHVYDDKAGIALSELPDGKHVLYYYGVDQVENREQAREYAFYLDRTPPRVAHTLIGNYYATEIRQFISMRTRIQLKATDAQMQVQSIEYRVRKSGKKDSKQGYSKYATPFTPLIRSGEFTVNYRGIDALRNRSNPKSLNLVMDSQPPKTQFQLRGSNYTRGGGVFWIASHTQIRLDGEDDLSGMQKIEYQLAGQPTQAYAGPMTLENEGQYLFRFWGTDQVNNREVFTPILLLVDNAPPEIAEVFSTDPLRTEEGEGSEVVNVYPINTTLFLSAVDPANVKRLEFLLDDGPAQPYKDELFFTEPGRHRIWVRAQDNVDNTAAHSAEFVITDAP